LYGVMATGLKEGFIEVVQQAETICKIQVSIPRISVSARKTFWANIDP
jgi:hypothetical protein